MFVLGNLIIPWNIEGPFQLDGLIDYGGFQPYRRGCGGGVNFGRVVQQYHLVIVHEVLCIKTFVCEGRIRKNLAGKRVNFSARTVISPDPKIKLGEVGIPIVVAMDLTIPETVNSWNFAKLKELLDRHRQILSL
jgi:hypothetical protein